MDKSLEAFVNLPLGDDSAMRVSAYNLTDGGFIDNVPSTMTFTNSGVTIDNNDVAEEDYNTCLLYTSPSPRD